MADNPLLSNLVAAWGGDESLIPDREEELFPDETQSSRFSEFIRDARNYLIAKTDAREFVELLAGMTRDLRECLESHDRDLAYLQLSPFQTDLARAARGAYFQFLEALSEMVASFTMSDLPRVESGIELCKKSAIVLERWAVELRILHRKEQGIVCGVCGNYCQPGFENCPFCNAELPSLSDPYKMEDDWVTVPDLINQVYQGMLAVQKGQVQPGWLELIDGLCLDAEDFCQLLQEWLDWDDKIYDLQDDLEDEVTDLLEAGQTFLRSLKQIREFPQQKDPKLVDGAWYHLLDSIVILQFLGRECRRSLWGLQRYFLRQRNN